MFNSFLLMGTSESFLTLYIFTEKFTRMELIAIAGVAIAILVYLRDSKNTSE